MKSVLKEEINLIKKMMNITENLISVKDGGYSNVGTDNDATSTDKINKSLLDDIEKAAKNAGVKITITTASSGHPSEGTSKSRHSSNTAVDIAIIDGQGSGNATDSKSGNSTFREKGTRLKDALVRLGYTWNTESGNPKSVLWQTTTGGNHFNHLHVSNTNKSGTSKETSTDPSTTTTDLTTTTQQKTPQEMFMAQIFGDKPKEDIGLSMDSLSKFGINEQQSSTNYKKISNGNENIVSYVRGEVSSTNFASCTDYVTIYFVRDFKGYYLTYCGIENLKVNQGQTVDVNTTLGFTLDPVYIYFYDSQGRALPISFFNQLTQIAKKNPQEKSNKKVKQDKKTATGKAFDSAKNQNLGGFVYDMVGHFINPFANRYDDKGNKIYKGITLNPLKADFYKQGVVPRYSDWKSELDYKEGDKVRYNGDTYEAEIDIKKGQKTPKDSDDWNMVEIQGNLSQLYKYSTKNPNSISEEVNRIRELLK